MSYNDLSPAMKKMVKARVNLTLDNPFFGQIALKLKLRETTDVPTAGVNSRELVFNPEWINTLSNPQLKGLVAHEVMHLVFMHHLRRGQRNYEKWNSAGDYVINLVLEDSGFTLPPDGLLDPKFKDQSTDHVYNQLPDKPKGDGGKGGKWGTGWGEVFDDAKGKTESEINHAEAEMKITIAEAAQVAKMAGKLPASMEAFIDQLMDAQVDWREKLRTFMSQVSRNDYDWSKPNKRFMQMEDGVDFYFPRLYSEEAGKITVAIDTSGSVSDKEIAHFFGELNAIVDEVSPSEMDIIDIDARIQKIHKFTSDEYPIDWQKLGIKGRGGTAFSPVFEHYRKNQDEEPLCLIYLTDLCCDDFGDEPDFPVLWVSTSNLKEVPFGEVTQIDV